MQKFQSTHPLRGATRHVRGLYAHRPDFNPRTPCGVRQGIDDGTRGAHAFQSTHPLRGATGCVGAYFNRLQHFNPRTPCGVRPEVAFSYLPST